MAEERIPFLADADADGFADELDIDEGMGVTIRDEDGKEYSFIELGQVELPGGRYIALLPEEDDDDEPETEVTVLRMEEDENGEVSLTLIEDEQEWDEVSKAFSEMFPELIG
ncbi:MAG: DUF1292 domain-containing protein [Oscillospiraceae bacterium]|nr:DUF1292 domain-containing protein [Oscillospiraceae bacterium]